MKPIDWLLGHLDKPGVAEIVLGVGRPAAVRTAEGFQPITSMNFERAEIETLLAGTPLSGLIGSPTSLPPAEVQVDARRLIVEVVRQGYNAALRITLVGSEASGKSPTLPPPTTTITPSRTATTTAAPRTATTTAAPRTETTTAAPRTATTTQSPSTVTPETTVPADQTPIVSVRMTSPTSAARTATPTSAPRTATTTTPPTATTTTTAAPRTATTAAPGMAATTGAPSTLTPETTVPPGHTPMVSVRMTSPTSAPRTATTTTPPRTATTTTPPTATTTPPRTVAPSTMPPVHPDTPIVSVRETSPTSAPRTSTTTNPPLTVTPLSTTTMPRLTAEPIEPTPAPAPDAFREPRPVEGIDHSFATSLGGGGEIVDEDNLEYGAPTSISDGSAPNDYAEWYGPQIVDEHTEIAPVHALLEAAYRRTASDLHIIASQPVTIRRLGELTPLDAKALTQPFDRSVFTALLGPLDATAAERFLLPLLGPSARQRLGEVGYVDLGFQVPGRGRVRANISHQQDGLAGTFRLCRDKIPTLDGLGLPRELEKTVRHHQGLVVIAGPSGAGKTTTMAALVDLLNTSNSDHIITIEDPVEIEHPAKRAIVSHREVGRHTLSFVSALKASLREDPDVIVIGELRDRETVEIALAAAETGHLVLSTISTPSAVKTIDRLIDMFPPDDQVQVRASISGTLRAVIAQRLLPNAARDGHVAAIELVTGVLPLATMIRDNKLFQLPSLMQRGRAFGMIRLDDSLAEHVRARRITEEVALAAAENKKDLAAALSGRPTPSPTSTRGLFGGRGPSS